MTFRGTLVGGLLGVALCAGTLLDSSREKVPRTLAGYQILDVDFHVHTFPQTWSTLAPWDTAIEARRQGLDAIAIVPHDDVWASKIGRWFARLVGGPIVLVGEEITTPGYHLLGVGITTRVATDLSAARAIDEVHRQGGVAIAAHPYRNMWPAYDAEAMARLDGAEVVRPETPQSAELASELRAFYERAPLAAIGSSDYHGFGTIGYARTLVFARERTEQGIVDAIRAHRTVVYNGDQAYGDPALIALASQDPALNSGFPTLPVPGAGRLLSRLAGVLGIAAMAFTRRREP